MTNDSNDYTMHRMQNSIEENRVTALENFIEQLERFGIGCFGVDPKRLSILKTNAVFNAFVGIDGDELVGMPLKQLLPEMEVSGIADAIESLSDGRESKFVRTLYVQRNGKHQRWGRVTFVRWGERDNDDEIVVATAVDVTDSVRAEQEREQTLQRMEMAQRHSQVGCWELVKGETTGWWSRQLFEMFGLSPDQSPPSFDQFLELIHPEDREKVINAHQSELFLHNSMEIEFRRNPEIGEMRWFRAKVKCIDRGGEVIWFGTTQDISERQQIESALISSEKLYREIVESAAEGISVVDVDGNIVKTNQVAANMFGYEPEELVGVGIFELIGESSKQSLASNFKKRADGVSEATEYRVKHRDGHEVWVLVSSRPLYDDLGDFCGTRNTVINITHRKFAEELTRKAEIAKAKLDMLSDRERSVFSLVAAGQMNKVIAKRLDVSEKTVERYRSSVMKKLGVKGIAELVRIALEAESVQR
ncbi:PAS domain S-box-containing protein [Rhodopirellula rubra]|uniref:histidine kinase n=1 Tax=Aporhodopirellula rubra TaxID=980271 RepID=A0A7W5H813_9BACT|nr:PAS domain S-box protein [Aporhodopirellula rubra]MBB3208988.1 PAS domain S-box-containing protein [Aporhodopirellula rubra]